MNNTLLCYSSFFLFFIFFFFTDKKEIINVLPWLSNQKYHF